MRQVHRPSLTADTQGALNRFQANADKKQKKNLLDVAHEWKNARRRTPMQSVLAVLSSMTGRRERCMYCLDSHGTDIDHFWPKSPYPEKMFSWPNLLLSCTECGRLKSDMFPLAADGSPLLVDPTAENPWLHLDFDPQTGNMVSRFESDANTWSAKGTETVRLLNLDRREALAVGYRKTYCRLARHVEQFLAAPDTNPAQLITALLEDDEHGLLWWCLRGSGQNEPPFSHLRQRHPNVWNSCVGALT